jgi:hypothetical protein
MHTYLYSVHTYCTLPVWIHRYSILIHCNSQFSREPIVRLVRSNNMLWHCHCSGKKSRFLQNLNSSVYKCLYNQGPRSPEYGEVLVILERSGSVWKEIASYYDNLNFSLSSSQGEVGESRETISPKSPCMMVPDNCERVFIWN